MKPLGIVCNVDHLGRIVISSELWKSPKLAPGTPMEIFGTGTGIFLQPAAQKESPEEYLRGFYFLVTIPHTFLLKYFENYDNIVFATQTKLLANIGVCFILDKMQALFSYAYVWRKFVLQQSEPAFLCAVLAAHFLF